MKIDDRCVGYELQIDIRSSHDIIRTGGVIGLPEQL